MPMPWKAPERPVMSTVQILQPAEEPLTLAEAKAFARIEASDDDALVQAFIRGARLRIEVHTRRCLVTQGWRVLLDALPPGGLVRLPLTPVQAVTAVMTYDALGAATALPASAWTADVAAVPPRLVIASLAGTPRAMAGIAIDVTAGYGSAADVPEPLRQAVRLLVAAAYEERGLGTAGAMPAAAAALLAPYRVRGP